MAENTQYEGGCQCGALRYQITAAPLVLYACHCSECQTQSGSAFGMSLAVPSDAFSMRSGTPKVWTRSSASGHGVACAFCAECGVRIYHRPERKPGSVNVKPGTLDDTGWLDPAAHLWTGSAQPWINLADGRIQAVAQPDDFRAIRAAWQQRSGI